MGKENVKTVTNKAKKETTKDGKKAKEKKVEKEEVAAPSVEELLQELSVSAALSQALTELREPDEAAKARIQDDVKELAWKFKAECEGYKFEARGPLFSDQRHVSSAEIYLVKDGKGGKETLPPEDCQALYDVARHEFEHVSSICVGWADGEAWGKNGLSRKDLSSVAITGPKKVPGGWMLPTTMKLMIAHSKHATDVKITDVVDNFDKGDLASVIIQLFDVLKNKKKIRDDLAAVDDAHLGSLRFLALQLQMLDDMGAKAKEKAHEYILNDITGLNLSALIKTKEANDALQARANAVLKATIATVAPHVKPSSARDKFQKAADRAIR